MLSTSKHLFWLESYKIKHIRSIDLSGVLQLFLTLVNSHLNEYFAKKRQKLLSLHQPLSFASPYVLFLKNIKKLSQICKRTQMAGAKSEEFLVFDGTMFIQAGVHRCLE